MYRTHVQSVSDGLAKLFLVVNDRAARATQRERRANHQRKSQLIAKPQCIFRVVHQGGRRDFQTNLAAGILNQRRSSATLMARSEATDHLHFVFFKDATVGGQTALNLAVELSEGGILEKYKVEMIGASLRAIKVAEDRLWFKDACRKIGLEVPASALVNNAKDALRLCDQLGFPLVIRPSFTLGGTGGSIVYNKEEFGEAIAHALDMSPVHEALVEESVLGWKEYELEVMRDFRDNFVVICTIENFDPMGVHTGDSITVAPAQTLTDKEFQRLRDASAAIIREVGVETGGSNVQFAVNPEKWPDGGYRNESARFAQLGAGQQGNRLSDRENRGAIGRGECHWMKFPMTSRKKNAGVLRPTIDYVVVKIPKWQLRNFPARTALWERR